MRHPPRPTLFPYTTLFRSTQAEGDTHAMAAGHATRKEYMVIFVLLALLTALEIGVVYVHAPLAPLVTALVGLAITKAALVGDRKSTRLNSSHTVISYAVFC